MTSSINTTSFIHSVAMVNVLRFNENSFLTTSLLSLHCQIITLVIYTM